MGAQKLFETLSFGALIQQALTRASVTSRELPGRAEIEDAVVKLRELVAARNVYVEGENESERYARVRQADEQYRSVARRLSHMLRLDEGAALLRSQRLLVVGDGELQHLPFAALLVPLRAGAQETPATRSLNQGDGLLPLLAYHEIENPPSMSVVAELRRERESAPRPSYPKTIAVIGDPVFSTEDVRCCGATPGGRHRPRRGAARPKLAAAQVPSGSAKLAAQEARLMDEDGRIARLRFAGYEADGILSLVPAESGRKAMGFDANRELLADGAEMSQYRILHFATHGVFNPRHPELSGLLLSMVDRQGRPQNGFLQMYEIYGLRLPSELVVLSACETGTGKIIRGEGLNGMARGFMYAGSRRVIASLWKIHDASTQLLMKSLYENLNLKEGGDPRKVRPASALRAAQLEMARQRLWRQPYYWAAFVIQGEPD